MAGGREDFLGAGQSAEQGACWRAFQGAGLGRAEMLAKLGRAGPLLPGSPAFFHGRLSGAWREAGHLPGPTVIWPTTAPPTKV